MTIDEQFEAWFASKFPKINDKAADPTDPVRGQVKEVARYAWKYSRETLEIELPEPVEIESVGVGCTFTTECYDISEVLERLRDQGLRVKPC